MNDYPIVVILKDYRHFDWWLYVYKKNKPNCIIDRICRNRIPYEVVIDNKLYVFVSYDTSLRYLKGKTYYDIEGNLYHSGYLKKAKEELLRARAESNAQKGIWITKDGIELNIKDMTTSHINNCINLIKRNDTTDMFYPYLLAFEKELKAREE